MGTERDKSDRDYEVGYGRPPKASRWKTGQSGNPERRARRASTDAELIERLFRRSYDVVEGGKTISKTGFAIVFAQLMAKESAGDRRAANVRDRYQRFAMAQDHARGALLRYRENDYTRQFSVEQKQDGVKDDEKRQEPVQPQAQNEIAVSDVAKPTEIER